MSKIEWTEKTWNPIVGCSIVSPGCTNCYAMRMARRIELMSATQFPRYAGLTKEVNGKAVWTGKMARAPEATLLAPLKRKKPTMYFVNSMSDLFHEDLPDEWIDQVFAVMALTPQHTYQVLTKRSARMRDYLSSIWTVAPAPGFPRGDGDKVRDRVTATAARMVEDGDTVLSVVGRGPWPLPNVWLGVSAERQREADARVPDLLATPAAVRFVSAEPLLGPINFTSMPRKTGEGLLRPLDGRFNRLDWIIVGGESGNAARPMHPQWAKDIRDQCTAAGVAFFFKQWGEWINEEQHGALTGEVKLPNGLGDLAFQRAPKAVAGRLLDGRTWDEMPAREMRNREAA